MEHTKQRGGGGGEKRRWVPPLPASLLLSRLRSLLPARRPRYYVRYFIQTLDVYEVSNHNRVGDETRRRRRASLPRVCPIIHISGESRLDVDVRNLLMEYNPNKLTVVTDSQPLMDEIFSIWEASWTVLRVLILSGEISLPPISSSHAPIHRLLAQLTKLHLSGHGPNLDVLLDIISSRNQLDTLRVREVEDVDVMEGIFTSPHCRIHTLGLSGEGRNFERVLSLLYHCDTLRTLEIHDASESHLLRVSALIEQNRFPFIQNLIVTSRRHVGLQSGYRSIRESHAKYRQGSLLFIKPEPLDIF